MERSELPGAVDTCLEWCLLDARVEEAVALVRDAYWNSPWEDEVIAGAMQGSGIFVGVEHDGALIATARATTDRSKMTYIGDVAVRLDWRGRGVGDALIRHLLAHPWAQTQWTSLHTRTPTTPFYAPMGFELWPPQDHPNRPIELRRYSRDLSGTGRS